LLGKGSAKFYIIGELGVHFIATSLPGFVCWPRTLLGKGSAKFYSIGELGVYPVANFMQMKDVVFSKGSPFY